MSSLYLLNPPNSTIKEHVLTVLSKCYSLTHLKQLQSFLISFGYSQSEYYAFKLVRFCLQLSNLHYARSIFDHLNFPDIYLYTAMVSAYAALRDHDSAFALYRHMLRRGDPKPNQFLFPHILKSSHTTPLVHTQITKSGFSESLFVQTALIDSYSRSSSGIGTARHVFDEMSERSVVSWTAMISGYAKLGEIENAVSLLDEMPERDVPSWNAVISGCTQNGLFSEAVSIFRKMINLARQEEQQHRQNRPNQGTVVCALSACGHTGMLQLGKWIHGYVYRTGLGSDLFVLNALIDMYGKCGKLKEARMVFEIISKKNLTSWNSMINCFALSGQSERAFSVFEEMMQCGDGIKPDGITFVSLLHACLHGGFVENCCLYFQMMTEVYGIEPQIEHYGSLVDILGRSGRIEEALEVARGMKIEPGEVIWGSLLNGCKQYGRVDLAEYAVKKLMEIDQNNKVYGIILANLYGGLGRWDEVSKVRKKLKKLNAYKKPGCSLLSKKTPGCTWIEIDNQVHQFYSVDRTHPKTEEIYMLLESLVHLISLSCWSSADDY